MKLLKRLCVCLAMMWVLSPVMTACDFMPQTSGNSVSENSISSNSEENISSENNSSTEENNGENTEELLAEAERIMDAAYALKAGESLDGVYQLSGVVSEIDISYTASKGICLYMRVLEPKNRELYCFRLKGTYASEIKKGDTITVSGSLKNYRGMIEFDQGCTLVSRVAEDGTTSNDGNDPYKDVSRSEFYANYTPATSNEDAYYRSLHGFMSGSLTTPDQAPTIAENRPTQNGLYVRNESMIFDASNKEYTVVDVYGNEAFTVYADGAYITLEEVAAYVYAFGTYPKNYTTSKDTSPSSSVWKEYLRLNHTAFSGNTSKYPYEPKLPNISGCGGDLNYYEMDIGTTGTDCDPAYESALYNNGNTITRGAARIVYGKNDLNRNGVYEIGEFHVFYTYNHYNDFQEYLNYVGGWGEMFGNITGGGTISSKYDYNPTAYVNIVFGSLPTLTYTALAINENACKLPYFYA